MVKPMGELGFIKYCTWVNCNNVSWLNLPEDNPDSMGKISYLVKAKSNTSENAFIF